MYQQPYPPLLVDILRATLSHVEYYGGAIENPATLRELKRALHTTIAELELTTRSNNVISEVPRSMRLVRSA
jgi:hypothetical protein